MKSREARQRGQEVQDLDSQVPVGRLIYYVTFFYVNSSTLTHRKPTILHDYYILPQIHIHFSQIYLGYMSMLGEKSDRKLLMPDIEHSETTGLDILEVNPDESPAADNSTDNPLP